MTEGEKIKAIHDILNQDATDHEMIEAIRDLLYGPPTQEDKEK